jgi:hypothetical protein
MVLLAPPLLSLGAPPTMGPVSVPVGAVSIAGASSNTGNIVYAGVPVLTSVVNSNTGQPAVPDSQSCPSPPPAGGCGTPITLTANGGALQATGPLIFDEPFTGTELSTQYTYTVASDTQITTQSVQQNPDIVTPVVCTNSGCNVNPSVALYVYPPGDPSISSLSAMSGPAQGGNQIVLSGSNLGCAVEVLFGTVPALQVSNAQAFLDCGQTNTVNVTVPPGTVGPVPVTIVTVESEFTGSGSNAVTYTYNPSAPSAPQSLNVIPDNGAATVTWQSPATDGGDAVSGYALTAVSPGWTPITASVKPTAQSHLFSHLQPGVPWTFSVTAASSLGRGLRATSAAVTLNPGDNGYIVATSNGGTFGFGSLSSSGGPGGRKLHTPIVGIAATANALGYVEVAAGGRVFNFGNAGNYGWPRMLMGQTAVGIAETADGGGYWVLLSNGVVKPFGDAQTFAGPTSLPHAVAIAATPDAQGYYIAQANGTVTAFGDATPNLQSGTRAGTFVGLAVDPAAAGYWLLGRNGQVIPYGAAQSYGSPVIGAGGAAGIAATPDGLGYWVVSAHDTVYRFGSAQLPGHLSHVATSNAVGIVAG